MIGDQQLMTGLKTKCTIALFCKKAFGKVELGKEKSNKDLCETC